MTLTNSTFQSLAFQVELVAIFFPIGSHRCNGLGEQDLSYLGIKFEIKSDHILNSLQFTFFLDKYCCIFCKNQF